MEFSHHSSNPLEARTSDSLNAKYHEALQTAQGDKTRTDFQSSDFGGWHDQQDYHNHINETVGAELFPPLPGPFSVTPKAGSKVKFIDLDAGSDDELALKDDPETTYTPKVEEMESIETIDVTVPIPLEDEDDPDDVKVDEWDQPGGDLFEGDYFPEEDEEMQSGGDGSQLRSMSPLTPMSSHQSSPYSSPQSSRPPSPDESKTLFLRLPEEQEEILDEMQQLYNSVPELCEEYDLVDRLGTGTFSSVYKAIDLRYNEWDNRPWLGHHPPESSAHYQSAGPVYKGRGGRATRPKEAMDVDEEDDRDYFEQATHMPGKVFVAIKRIYTTSGPERIRNELSILEDCRGCRHTSQIITAFRNNDQVVIVLPYQRNMDFREFYQSLHPDGIKCYFRCLFRALRDIHARGIIHRDVKPANFLYDPFTGIGTLCDFGLASRMEETTHINQPGRCLHDPPSEEHPHGRNRKLDPYEINNLKQAQVAARTKSSSAPEKVGYPEQDRRPVSKANRAGTRGFRAPEVLLKCNSQTGAIDVWAAGIIMLFFLTGKFPIFQSNDDVEGLMEIALIIGRKNVEKVATLHGRTFATNIPDLDQDGITWREFVERLNPDISTPKKYDMRFYPHNSKHRDGRHSTEKAQPILVPPSHDNDNSDLPTEPPQQSHQVSERHANPPSIERHTHQLSLAYHFLDGLLKFDSTKRYTPRQALYHNFLDEANVDGDDQFMPHRIGEGVCGEFHFRDYQNVHCIKVSRRCTCEDAKDHELSDADEDAMDNDNEDVPEGHLVHEILQVEAGQGIPIGKSPCEYHRTLFA